MMPDFAITNGRCKVLVRRWVKNRVFKGLCDKLGLTSLHAGNLSFDKTSVK